MKEENYPKCGDWFKLIDAKALKRTLPDAEKLEQGDHFRFLEFTPSGAYECYCPKIKGSFALSGEYLTPIKDVALIRKLEEEVPMKFKRPYKPHGQFKPPEKNEAACRVAEEIVHTLIGYLNDHLNGGRGYMGQDPYRSDIWDLFERAYKSKCYRNDCAPMLTADALLDYLNANWAHNAAEGDQKSKLLSDLHERWHHWSYAWKKIYDEH